jgi:hypothetical protein
LTRHGVDDLTREQQEANSLMGPDSVLIIPARIFLSIVKPGDRRGRRDATVNPNFRVEYQSDSKPLPLRAYANHVASRLSCVA